MNDNHVTQVSSTEEYFTADRDQVHCKHGSYIGYAGGADYICSHCEDGHDAIAELVQYVITFILDGREVPYKTVYSQDAVDKVFIDLQFIADHPRSEIVVTEGTYQFWCSSTDEELHDHHALHCPCHRCQPKQHHPDCECNRCQYNYVPPTEY